MATDDLDHLDDRPSRRERDDGPAHEPMRSRRSAQGDRGELVVLVRRFLLKNLGLPWEAVFRELQHTSFGASHATHRAVLLRIHDLVADDVVEHEGELARRSPHTGEVTPLSAETRQHPLLYVCPTSGVLRRHVPDDARNKIRLSENEQVRRLGKRWYFLTLAPIPEQAPARRPIFDVVLRVSLADVTPRLRAQMQKLYGQPGVYACERRQISKAELARLRPGA